MADYSAKTFVYDVRGKLEDQLQDKLDDDISAFLTANSALHFDSIAVSINDSVAVATILWNDVI